MSIQESDVKKNIAEVEATSWCLREMVRVRELAATHRLIQMRHLRMLEEQKVWKREAGFDYIDTTAEMVARRSRTNLVSEPFFYSKMFIQDAHIPMRNSHLRWELTSRDKG